MITRNVSDPMPNRTTEARNAASTDIDQLSALEIVDLMNREDAGIAGAVAAHRSAIADAIESIAQAIRQGGRLFYIGAGTSGRLGVLDASECPPTFSTPPEMVVGVIAGGPSALTRSIEGAEDDPNQSEIDLRQYDFGSRDVLVGIATSGRTPYVVGALKYARRVGAKSIGITCNQESDLHHHVDIMIAPVVGPEVISGSTRLKAGTATKMVLNMLTTGAMVLLGKTYGNLMVDLRASNNKLRDRSVRIVSEVTGISASCALKRLQACGGEVKVAIVAELADVDETEARRRLNDARGQLRAALKIQSTPGD